MEASNTPHSQDSSMPHTGNLVLQKMKKVRFSIADLARSLQLADVTVSRQLRHAGLRSNIIWGAGLAMKHNFFADLAVLFPYPAIEATNPDPEKEALRARIKELEIEVAVLERILKKD